MADVDPTEVVSLLDALESPGELAYSDAARERFAQLAAELRELRQHAGEPVLDLARRVITMTGLDVELMATPEFARTNRRDQLGAFLDAVAEYVDVDGDASLSGVLAYLQAEIDTGSGLEQAVPSDREAVKLLTVHKAKGLEWEVVFLPALMTGIFPSDRVTDNWVSNPAVLPADLRGDADAIPQLADHDNAALATYKRALSDRTIPCGGPAGLRGRHPGAAAAGRQWSLLAGRSDQSTDGVDLSAGDHRRGRAPERAGLRGTRARPGQSVDGVGRADALAGAAGSRGARTPSVGGRRGGRFRRSESAGTPEPELSEPLLLDAEETVAGWDADIERLLLEAQRDRTDSASVELPASLSASAVLRLGADPEGYAAELARPMPRPPSRAARFGTRFHGWVERYLIGLAHGELPQPPLIDTDDLDEADERTDADLAGETELRELCDAFAAGRFGAVVPCAVETPFTLLIGGRLVRGRIDAVYERSARPQQGQVAAFAELTAPVAFVVVDWKTGRADQADPLQLALYRQAWADLRGVSGRSGGGGLLRRTG